MRINARAVLVLPWFVLVALTMRGRRVPRLLPIDRRFARRACRRRAECGRVRLDQSSRAIAAGAASVRRCARPCCGRRVTGRFLFAIAVAGAGLAAAGVSAFVVRPAPRLAPRVRPYTVATRARLRWQTPTSARSCSRRDRAMAAGCISSSRHRSSRSQPASDGIVERRSDESLALSLRQAGYVGVTPDDYRTRVAQSVGVVRRRRCGLRDRRLPVSARHARACRVWCGLRRVAIARPYRPRDS